jgi:uncharacterized protein DUF4232
LQAVGGQNATVPIRHPLTTQDRVVRMVRHRRMVRRMKITSVVLLALVVGAAVAFGIDKGISFGRHLWAEHHRPAPPPASTTTVFAPSTTTIPGTPCSSAQLNAYLYNWRITSGTLYEVVAVTSRSSTPCTLAGYPMVVATGQDGGALPSSNRPVVSLGVPTATSPAPVTVSAGQGSWFEFSYPVNCTTILAPGSQTSVVPGDCFQGTTLGVFVSQGATALAVNQPLQFTYGVAGFSVGPFQQGIPPSSPPVG